MTHRPTTSGLCGAKSASRLRRLLMRSAPLASAMLSTSDQPSLGIVNGDPIPGAPKWNADASTEYDVWLTDSVKGFAMVDGNWVGSSHGTVLKTDPDYSRPTYSLLSMNAGIDYEAWEFALFAKNALNDQKIIQRPNLQSVNRGYTLTPRTIGISASFKF
jgi:iron complex outermembrane recepter protein